MRQAVVRFESGSIHKINFGYDHTIREAYKKITTPKFLDGTTPYNEAHAENGEKCIFRTDKISEVYFGDWDPSDEDLTTVGGLYLD